MKIYAVTVSPFGQAPSQRFRHEQYLRIFEEHNIHLIPMPFYDEGSYKVLYQKGRLFQKFTGLLFGFVRRIIDLFRIALFSEEIVLIHREAAPIGPPVFEWCVAQVLGKKVVFDFDDAIWMAQSDNEPPLKLFLKNPVKANSIMKWAWKVSCGNNYLAEHAKKYNQCVIVNPTTVDTTGKYNTIKSHREVSTPVIGWTGSHSTLMYLEPLLPLIDKLSSRHSFELLIICNQQPDYLPQCASFVKWNEATEMEDLLKMDVGIMPLADTEWAKGKCGFKAIQYMALGIPALVSPVGVNTEIVDHGVNGYYCTNEDDWEKYLLTLLYDLNKRVQMGSNARKKIVDRYSVVSNQSNFLSLFDRICK